MTTIAQLKQMIGKTPLLEIRFLLDQKPRRIFAKAEWYNLTGSIKDRVACDILEKAYREGTIRPGAPIVEATSGNTGISFSAIGRALGHPVTIYMPDWMSRERIVLMESYGAQVRLVSREEGGFLGSIQMAQELAWEKHGFLPRQFENEENIEAHYYGTGQEIVSQLADLGLRPDGVVAGVGTGGTVVGIGRRIKEASPSAKVFPLEPANSPTLSTGYKVGRHRIQGISDEFIPDIVKRNPMDDIIAVDDGDSIRMARMLSQDLGLGVGVSSGANFLGCVMALEKLDSDAVITTVFADDNKKYLSTDYANPPAQEPGTLSGRIQLVDYLVHPIK